MARDHRAGGEVEPHAERMGQLFNVGSVSKAYRALDRYAAVRLRPGGCAPSTESGEAGAGAIHSRISTGTLDSYG